MGFSANGAIAMFDDFAVTGPNIPDGGPGAKAVNPKDKLATMWARLKAPEKHKDFRPKRREIQEKDEEGEDVY